MLTGNILLTGGAGFLGRALLRRIEREHWPVGTTCILSRDDSKHAAVERRFPWVQSVIADVGLSPVEHLTDLMRGFDTVIHMAASKYVDRAEHDAIATIQTNVIGSLNVAEAARRARVQRVVGISTDKSVSPTNCYGMTKMAMERIFQESARLSDTRFCTVRYGNVVGSTGSVIPIFMEAARAGLPIRLTDPSMTRFFMSPDEAVDTVLAGLDAPNGHILIPACRSMTMCDLTLMALGYEGHDVLPTDGRVEVIGVRPGEKRHEALVQRQESIRATRVLRDERHPDGGWRWLHIAPPDSPPCNEAPFEVTSDQPPLGWIGMAEMRAIIADASQV